MVAVLLGSLCFVAYVFIGYPALVGLLGRLRPRPVHTDSTFTPSVSIVIAAYDEEESIEYRLQNVADLDYPMERVEVIVVADGSRDATAERARSFSGVRVLARPEREGKLAAITRGIEVASGEIFVLSDANNRYTPEALRELVAPLADPSVGLVTGRKAIDDGTGRALDRAEGLYWRYESKLKEWEGASGSVVGVAGEILAFRRDAYHAPETGFLTEDFVQAMLVATDGWRIAYAPRAVSLERASATIEDEAKRRARLVTGRSQAMRRLLPSLIRDDPGLAWRVVSHKALRPLVPWALIAAVVSNVAATRRRPWTRALVVAQAAFYSGAVMGWRNERAGRRNRLTYLPFFFCQMNLAAIRGLRDFARSREAAVWNRVRRG